MLILAAAILIVEANNCRAQSQNVPNLGGTWELIEYDGVTKDRLGSKFPKLTLAISQTASEVKITQKGFRGGVEEVREFTYYTDGRGETNTGRVQLWPGDVPKFESITRWQKDRLMSDYKEHLSRMTGSSSRNGGDYATSDTYGRRQDEWRLATNGETLELKSSSVDINSTSVTGHRPASGGTLDDRGEMAPKFQSYKQKLVFRKTS